MNAAAEQGSIGFEKNKLTSLGHRSNQMRNSRMMQGLASSDPNDRRAARNNFADPFVRNRMVGIVMQNFCRIHKLNRTGALRGTRLLRELGHGEVSSKPQGKPHHAL